MFKKGNKYGKGRPKRKNSMQFALMSALNAKYGSFENGVFKIADSLVNIAQDQEHPHRLHAIKEIFDRIDGKPDFARVNDGNQQQVTIVMPKISIEQGELIEHDSIQIEDKSEE